MIKPSVSHDRRQKERRTNQIGSARARSVCCLRGAQSYQPRRTPPARSQFGQVTNQRKQENTHLELRAVELVRRPRKLIKVDLRRDLHLARVDPVDT